MRDDRTFMARAIRLAERGRGRTSPNPMVGAVITRNGLIVGEGYHQKAGLEHAEAAALREAGKKSRGATLYVNLEPCGHFGRTPACSDAIIRSGIKRVVAAMKDPNPLNNGKGFGRLKKAGIKVTAGILEKEAGRLNEVFVKYITTRRPFVTVKVAESLDGKIATKDRDSKWISGGKSRVFVHRLRAQNDAIMVGAGAVIADDPLLTSRSMLKRQNTRAPEHQKKQPIKIIVDEKLQIRFDAKIFSRRSPAKVIIATTKKADKKKMTGFEQIGAEIIVLNGKDKNRNMAQLIKELGKREITSVLVEGGGELIGSLVDAHLVDKFLFFIAPRIIGGRLAITPVEGEGVSRVSQAPRLEGLSYRKFGEDLLVEGYSCSRG